MDRTNQPKKKTYDKIIPIFVSVAYVVLCVVGFVKTMIRNFSESAFGYFWDDDGAVTAADKCKPQNKRHKSSSEVQAKSV